MDCIKPLLLLWPQPAGCSLDLDGHEHRNSGANHLGGDRDPLPPNQVSAALAQAKLNRAAILVPKRAGVIAEQPRVARAASDANLLLDLLLRCQGLAAVSVPAG